MRKASVMSIPYRRKMNAFTPLVEANHCGQSTSASECSLWRGRCIEEFAFAEAAVSEALSHLSTIATSGAEGLLPHLVGKRFEALRIAVDAEGPLAAVGSRVASALDEFKDLHRYRTFLCHGTSATIEESMGKWRLIIKLTSLRAAAIQQTTLEIGEDEAALFLARLRHARQRLDGQIRGMLASFRA